MPSFAKRLKQSQLDKEIARKKNSPLLRIHFLAPDLEAPHDLDVINIEFKILRNTHYRNLLIKVRDPRQPGVLHLFGHAICGRYTGISAIWNGHSWTVFDHDQTGFELLNWNRALQGD